MTGKALNIASGTPKALRVPVLPGRGDSGEPAIDESGDAYKAGVAAAAAEFAGREARLNAAHEEFVRHAGDMLAEMDARYRREALGLVERLFAAVAPTLAQKSSLIDAMQIVEERVLRGHNPLTLRVHPALVAHLPAAEERRLSATPEITLKADEACAPAMIDAQWAKGGLFHDPDGLIADILRVLEETRAAAEEKKA